MSRIVPFDGRRLGGGVGSKVTIYTSTCFDICYSPDHNCRGALLAKKGQRQNGGGGMINRERWKSGEKSQILAKNRINLKELGDFRRRISKLKK